MGASGAWLKEGGRHEADTARRSAVVAILGLTAAGASAESGTPVSLTTALALSPNQEGTR